MATGPYQGFAVFVDRGNSARQSLVGQSTLEVHGAVYAPNTAATVGNDGPGQFIGYGPVVVGDLELAGPPNRPMLFNAADNPTLPAGTPEGLRLTK
jgi:hypothetical protein